MIKKTNNAKENIRKSKPPAKNQLDWGDVRKRVSNSDRSLYCWYVARLGTKTNFGTLKKSLNIEEIYVPIELQEKYLNNLKQKEDRGLCAEDVDHMLLMIYSCYKHPTQYGRLTDRDLKILHCLRHSLSPFLKICKTKILPERKLSIDPNTKLLTLDSQKEFSKPTISNAGNFVLEKINFMINFLSKNKKRGHGKMGNWDLNYSILDIFLYFHFEGKYKVEEAINEIEILLDFVFDDFSLNVRSAAYAAGRNLYTHP